MERATSARISTVNRAFRLFALGGAFATAWLGTYAAAPAQRTASSYFNLGPHLVEEFRGTYEFHYKRVEFTDDRKGYVVHSSGDQSPSTDALLVQQASSVEWVLGGSGDKWILLRPYLFAGERWHHLLMDWNQEYRVVSVEETLVVPAGTFHNCAKIEITWIAHEHDLEGPQMVVLFLAPALGVIKREEWSGGKKWHEEVLTKFWR